jgi:NAD(P)-dependent dehydrogenase (short-subunit alcohol dehydrogenase family)
MSSARFPGKAVVIIGGSSGIGLAAAQAFAKEGAHVLITGRRRDALHCAATRIDCGVVTQVCDISDLRQIRELFECIRRRMSRIDVLFVNAGIGAISAVESVTEAQWELLHNVNVRGPFFSVQAALPLMSRGSTIILTGSIAATRGEPTVSVYAATKAALRSLGRSFAAELVGRGIRVNVISPGPVDTSMLQRIEGVFAEELPGIRERMILGNPMRRLGTSGEVAAAVLFLASDAASFITGAELFVDGGATGFHL